MTLGKRIFDILLALALSVVLVPVLVGLVVWLLIRDGGPVFYVSERMRAPGRPFGLIKLRTMRPAPGDTGVTGGDKADRITATGAFLRRTRLDEIPQLWNILKGDMSFVGPRPPLRQHVERFPALYARVLQSRPGVTGLATVVYHRHEERLIAGCATAEETDALYCRACVPRKARLDLIYQARRSMCMDLWLILRTAGKVTGRGGA